MSNCLLCNKKLTNYQKKFCSSSCSATYNNSFFPKRANNSKTFECLNCSQKFTRRPNQIAKGHTLYCGVRCMHIHRKLTNKNQINELFSQGKLKSRPQLRKILFERDGHCCKICNLTEWRNQPIPLWLDHIDGCALNNRPENLRLVCLNCDALGNTFGAKNKGYGRKSLGLKMYD